MRTILIVAALLITFSTSSSAWYEQSKQRYSGNTTFKGGSQYGKQDYNGTIRKNRLNSNYTINTYSNGKVETYRCRPKRHSQGFRCD